MYNYMPSLFYAALVASISHISLAESSSSGPGSAGRPRALTSGSGFLRLAISDLPSSPSAPSAPNSGLLYLAALASSSVQASSFPSSLIPTAPPTGFLDLVNANSVISLLRPKTSESSHLFHFHTLLPASHRSFWALPLNYTQNSTLALLSSLPRRSRPPRSSPDPESIRALYYGLPPVALLPLARFHHHSRARAIALKIEIRPVYSPPQSPPFPIQ